MGATRRHRSPWPRWLRGGDVAELPHLVENDVAPLSRGIKVLGRRVARGRLHDAGEHCRFRKREVRCRLAEVAVRRAFDTVRSLAEVDEVEVRLQELLLVGLGLELVRHQRFADLAGKRPFAAREEQLHDLLGDRAAALLVLPRLGVHLERAHDRLGIHPRMGVETLVLDRDDGVLHVVRDLVERDDGPVLLPVPFGQNAPVCRVDDRRLRWTECRLVDAKVGQRRRQVVEVAPKAEEQDAAPGEHARHDSQYAGQTWRIHVASHAGVRAPIKQRTRGRILRYAVCSNRADRPRSISAIMVARQTSVSTARPPWLAGWFLAWRRMLTTAFGWPAQAFDSLRRAGRRAAHDTVLALRDTGHELRATGAESGRKPPRSYPARRRPRSPTRDGSSGDGGGCWRVSRGCSPSVHG